MPLLTTYQLSVINYQVPNCPNRGAKGTGGLYRVAPIHFHMKVIQKSVDKYLIAQGKIV